MAERVRIAFLADEEVHDLKVRQVVAQQGHNLASYLAQIKDSQWASMVEMQHAAQILNIAVYLDMGKCTYKVGEGFSMGMVKLRQNHYRLYKTHRKKAAVHVPHDTQPLTRGGMMPYMPQQVRYDFELIHSMPEIQQLGILGNSDDTVIHMRTIIAALLGAYLADVNNVEFENGQMTTYPDWLQLSEIPFLYVHVVPKVIVRVRLPYGAIFHLEVDRSTPHVQVLEKIAIVVGVMPHFCDLVCDGQPWTFNPNIRVQDVDVHVIGRGGAGETEEVSEMIPFVPDTATSLTQTKPRDSQVLPVQPIPHPLRRESSRSRSRSPRQRYIPRNSWWSNAMPSSPQTAQHEPVSRPVWAANDHVGSVFASPLAIVSDVLIDIAERLAPHQRPTTTPSDAVLWDEVEAVWFPPMHYVTVLRFSDLRHTRWEMCQFPRIIPIIYTGPVDEYIVLPWNITVPQAQDRVDEWSRSNYYMDHIIYGH